MPFRTIRDSGIPICLGTDEALADDSINIWNAVKMAGLIHNITEPDYRKWPSADEVLACLFRGGARAMGKENDIGSIKPGKQADIALLDLNRIAFTPLNDIKKQLVYCENGSSVCLTMVAGEVVMRDGVVLTVDEEAIKREARELMNRQRPVLEAAALNAAQLEPYYREMYSRAASENVGMNRWGNFVLLKLSMERKKMLKGHNRYAYSPMVRRPTFRWPNGSRVAFYIALNVEQYSFGDGLVEDLVPGMSKPDVLNTSWREYGTRVGAWRLLDLFKSLGFPATILLNSEVCDHCPDLVAAMVKAGHEIAAHGRTNSESQAGLSEEEERKLIAERDLNHCPGLRAEPSRVA